MRGQAVTRQRGLGAVARAAVRSDHAAGDLADNGDGTYALTLVAPASLVTVFTDRPDRQAYTIAAETLMARWSSYGFTAVPPNAALVVHRARTPWSSS